MKSVCTRWCDVMRFVFKKMDWEEGKFLFHKENKKLRRTCDLLIFGADKFELIFMRNVKKGNLTLKMEV